MEKYFFEIPVYSRSESTYYKKCDQIIKKHFDQFLLLNSDIPREKAPESYANFERYLNEKYKEPWNYNQIVGWIKLYKLGDQIRGETWFIKARKVQHRIKNKKFYLIGKTFELICYQMSHPMKFLIMFFLCLMRLRRKSFLKEDTLIFLHLIITENLLIGGS